MKGEKKNSPRAQMMQDVSFGPILVTATLYHSSVRIYEMQPTHLNRKDNTIALSSAQCWVEMSISSTFVTNVSLMDYMLS